MNAKFLNRLSVYAISIAGILLLFLPHATVFNPEDGKENWEAAYMYDDIMLILIYTPFLLFWILYLLLKEGLARTIIIYLLLLLSFCFACISFLSVTMPAQDYEPHVGVLISFLLFPMMLGLLISYRMMSRKE